MKPAWKVAIVHYHCRPGGVTNVIRNAVNALHGLNIAATVLVGGPVSRTFGEISVRCVEGLNYDETNSGLPDSLAERMKVAAAEALGGPPDVWHIHNHALGKNLTLTAVIARLAGEGRRMLLQIHDFAEDGRPANYERIRTVFGPGGAWQNVALYPQADHVHYAVLNRRDQSWLSAAGADLRRVHWLPNAVALQPGFDQVPSETGALAPAPARLGEARAKTGARWVYPTRAIRRKNIGEFLLWAALSNRGEQHAVTLAPTNPADCAVYERWKALAADWKLPVEFEVGLRAGHITNVPWWRQGNGAVTTSVAEGFGLAFLEPWLANIPLVGRDLPDITCDLKSAGMDLSMLYSRLAVPLQWLDAARLKNQTELRLRETWRAYGREPSSDAIEQAWQAAADNDTIDFGRLDEDTQANVIRLVMDDASRRNELQPSGMSVETARRAVNANSSCVRRQFGLQAYGERLAGVYRDMLRSETGPVKALRMDALLDQILDPRRFNLMRT